MMAKLIKVDKQIEEGFIFNRFLHNRLIKNNKNVITATTGPTGSSKSYQDLRKAELWYRYHFKEEFPPENICFSIGAAVKRISSGKLRRGEIIILEEAGVNLGSLDFQKEVSKLFTYVLQSFRSMNIAIFFNLPYLSMLNKSARLLIHVQFITCGIDFENKIARSKAYFRQVNQDSGKVYNKYLRVNDSGATKILKRFKYSMPSDRLIDAYEAKKFKFVNELTKEFSDKLDAIDRENERKMARVKLTDRQMEVYELTLKGIPIKEIASILGSSERNIYYAIESIKKKGYETKKARNSLGKEANEVQNPPKAPI